MELLTVAAKRVLRGGASQAYWILLIIWILIPGSVLITFRPNGLPTMIFFALLFLIFYRKRSSLKIIMSSLAISSIVTLSTSYLVVRESPIDNFYAQEWMRNDISCYANFPKGIGFVEKWIPGIGNTDTWRSSGACTFLNNAKITVEEKVEAQEFIPSAWTQLIRKDPIFVLSTHLREILTFSHCQFTEFRKFHFCRVQLNLKMLELNGHSPRLPKRLGC
jgi:hypothetical protein